ncbi:MAG: nucleotidyltransferase family protein [Pseudomonadota bacterium]
MLEGLVTKAQDHGVAAIVLRQLVYDSDFTALSDIRLKVQASIVMTLKLRSVAAEISQFIASENLDATIVKGPVFANMLYKHRGDRPFTDIDVLCTDDARIRLGAFLSERGFEQYRRAVFDKSVANQEEKWVRRDVPAEIVELHGNLVHYPGLRRQASFGWRELHSIDPANPRAPLSLFFTAVVHASLGHKFHQLRLLVDILQAYRNLDASDRAAILDLSRDLRLKIETANSLRLVGEIFGQQDALDLGRRLSPNLSWHITRKVLTAQSVLNAPTHGSSKLHRHGFRWMQRAVFR